MSFSTLVFVGLLHFVGSAQGFSGVSGARFVSQRPRVLPALRAVNEFDAWQAARGALTTDAPGALPLSTDNVALVLGEFARSDFARRLCKPGSVSVVEHVSARHACVHVLFLFMSCVYVRPHAVHDVRTPRHAKRFHRYVTRACMQVRPAITRLAECPHFDRPFVAPQPSYRLFNA